MSFSAGFAAPGVGKWLLWYPDAANLIQAFVAAQMVHFCSVIALHTKFAAKPLQLSGPQIAITLAGFSIVLGAGITATPRTQLHVTYRAVHLVLLYMIWLILAADYAKHPIKSLRLVAIWSSSHLFCATCHDATRPSETHRHCFASFPCPGATKGDTFTGAGQSL